MLRSYEDLRNEGSTVGRDSLTERELDIMSVLWRNESGTVSEGREDLDGEPGYTTVLKILQILEEKGAIRHETEGRAYRYYPLIAPEEEGGRALTKILDKIFHGSAELMLARLVSDAEIPPDQIERMRLLLKDAANRAEEEDR